MSCFWAPATRCSAWCRLAPGAIVEKTFYLQPAAETTRGAGFQEVIAASFRIFDDTSVDGFTPYREILRLKFNDTLDRWREGDGFAGIDARFQEAARLVQ